MLLFYLTVLSVVLSNSADIPTFFKNMYLHDQIIDNVAFVSVEFLLF